ncbi:TetR/AcrR family transcriptional regulator [Ornithinimicrobium faecis]|uniref:TetR/AcrR family transcriptional regulator n=1 Tax=Ornithinimicrobium faecis TaxID=2934158 RepID=A0ABY4YTB8_9MICO|nr:MULTISPECIES: TetR/AcrR family transcriptional regulator [unclassified Ornithinimicrobium]USQ80019.1 TetR/AcrR family transcriptional regulator [Ornithinimicrobium sp. HY1793]
MVEKLLSRSERQARTHEELLDAAQTAFAERGFHATSVAEIALAAGYTKGAVYANFSGKTELFLAVLDRHIRRTREADPAGAADTADQFRRDWGLLTFEALMYAVREDPEMLQEIAERYRQVDQLHAEHLAAGAEDAAAAQDLAIAWAALGEGLMMRHLADPGHITHEVIERVFTRVFPAAGGQAR